jgi:RNA-directed DNA polymerase
MVLEPIYERDFAAHSYGFRPGMGCKDALRRVDELLKTGYVHVVDADLKSYFDTIPKDRLLALVAGKVADGRILKLVEAWLGQNVPEDTREWEPEQGTPQGAVISPLLSNIYLDPLDHLMAGRGFDFPGYRFGRGRRWPRKKSLEKFKDTIRAKTGRTVGRGLPMVIADINPTLRGWFGYFRHSTRRTFRVVDGWVRRRPRSIPREHQGKKGIAKTHGADQTRWPNACFAKHGLFSLQGARDAVSQSS